MAVTVYKDMNDFWKAHPELERPEQPKNITTDKNVTVEDPWGAKGTKEETKEEEVKDESGTTSKPKRATRKSTTK